MLASYATTPAVSNAPSPAASTDRAATEAAMVSALAHMATAYAAAATASLDQLVDVQEANNAPSGNNDA